MMDYLKDANLFLHNNKKTRDVIIIVSSIFIDCTFMLIAYLFVTQGKTARIMYSILIFYGMRGICQSFFLFQFQDNFCFEDPGFFSLLVPYGKAADFYFSGHSGFLLMATLEIINMKMIGIAFFIFLSMIYTAWMLVATRAHYSIGFLFLIQISL